jgi:hypothetical protein
MCTTTESFVVKGEKTGSDPPLFVSINRREIINNRQTSRTIYLISAKMIQMISCDLKKKFIVPFFFCVDVALFLQDLSKRIHCLLTGRPFHLLHTKN